MKGSPHTISGMAAIIKSGNSAIASATETHISNDNFGMKNYRGSMDKLRYYICAMKLISSSYYVGSTSPLSASDVSLIISKIQ